MKAWTGSVIDDIEWVSGWVARRAWGMAAVIAWIAAHMAHSPRLAVAVRLEVLPGAAALAALSAGLWLGRLRAGLTPAGG